MSPAGIVMTYVSEDAPTALHETANEVGTYAIGTFRTRRDIRILDLAELPPVPSLFEEVPDSLEYDGPKGPRNGNYRHGRYTAEVIASRRWLRELTRDVRALTKSLRQP
jgi:hypothetical protein